MLKKIKDNYVSAILLVVVLVQVLFLAYINIFRMSVIVDDDFAKMLRHMIEIVRSRNLFLGSWDYPSSTEIDCPLLLASLVYFITGRPYFSFAVANILDMALWGAVAYALMEKIGLGIKNRLLFFAMLFSCYSFGMLDYTNMMFYCGSQYCYKALIPVAFVTLLAYEDGKVSHWKLYLLWGLHYVLVLTTSVSTGLYMFICGLFPVMATAVVTMLLKKDYPNKKRTIIHICATVVLSLAGLLLRNGLGLITRKQSMSLRTGSDFMDALGNTVDSYFGLFKIFPLSETPATSIQGVGFVIRFVIAVFILVVGLLAAGKLFGIGFGKNKPEDSSFEVRDYVKAMLVSVFVWNTFILLMIEATTRYHIPGVISLMLCAAICFEDWTEGRGVKGNGLISLVVSLLFLGLSGVTVLADAPDYFEGKDAYYSYTDYAFCNEIVAVIDRLDVDSVLIVDDTNLPEALRVVDLDRSYETYKSQSGEIYNCDFYYIDRDRASKSDKNIIIVNESDYEDLPYYIKDYYEEADNLQGYRFLYAEHNPIDGISEIFKGVRSIDLATTPGYSFEGYIDPDGYLHNAQEGNALTSAYISAERPFEWALSYDRRGDSDFFAGCDVYRDGEFVGTYELVKGQDKVEEVFDIPGTYQFVVHRDGADELIVKEMEFVGK